MEDKLKGTLLGELVNLVEDCMDDYFKAKEKGIKTASTRVRKRMLEIKKLVTPIRKEMLDCRDAKSSE